MRKFATALIFFAALSFLAIRPAMASAWYTATVDKIGPVNDTYYVVYLTSASWGSTSRSFTIYPTLNNTMLAIGRTALTSSRTVAVLLNSTTANDYCMSMFLQ